MKNENYRIDVVGDLNYTDLLAEIYYENRCLATLSQEEGFKNIKIQIFPPNDSDCWELRLDEFEDILKKAKNRLWELRKTDKE